MQLGKNFIPLADYTAVESSGYRLLPFRFTPLDSNRERYLLTNFVGEPYVLSRSMLRSFIEHELLAGTDVYSDLKAKHFLADSDSTVAPELLGLKYRSKINHLANFTSLHLFVVTLRCDYSCPYCQVSRQTEERERYDMSEEAALAALDLVFQSPSRSLKIEFQGGEPLLNFDLIKFVVAEAEERNREERRDLRFVVATNLTYLSDSVLDYLVEHNIGVSASLDGPEDLHNANRPRPGKDGYQKTIEGIARARERLGPHNVSALMTTTEGSLSRAHEIIDEYVQQGFHGIFLRPLSPYGFAVKTKQIEKYDTERWLDFYREGLDYIIELNERGYPFQEFYTALMLRKLLTPYGSGYVDLQSPAGAGIAVIVYNYDGDVYATDEARMLAEMDDKSFQLGNVLESSYEDIFGNDILLDLLDSTHTDSVPMCESCAFNPACGADPVYHHATQGNNVGNKALSGFCAKNMGVGRHIFEMMEAKPGVRNLFQKWAWGC